MPMERKYGNFWGSPIQLKKKHGHRFWVSDEYGPYVHLFQSQGQLVLSIQPPEAILPLQSTSKSSTPVLNFTGSVNPTTGRAANQGISIFYDYIPWIIF